MRGLPRQRPAVESARDRYAPNAVAGARARRFRMARSKDDVELRGSERAPLKDARRVGGGDPQRQMQVTVTVRRRSSHDDPEALAAIGSQPGRLTRDEFAERFGADPEDLRKVEEFARAHGLEVVEASAPRRTVVLGGSIGDVSTAFGVDLAL